MKYLLLILPIFLMAEPSVYSDADFVDPSTLSKANSRKILELKEQISQLKEEIEGLKSLINSQASTIATLQQKVNNNSYEQILNQLSQRVATLESKPAQIVKIKDYEPSKNITTLDTQNIPKEEPKVDNKTLYTRAVKDFNNNRLTKAKAAFEKLLQKGYKTDSVNFYLGEIAYKQKDYTKAVSYFQTSASLNENASYMDKLLFHTAIALDKKGKRNEAIIFYQAVANNYPNSKFAKEAKAHLK